MSDDKDKKPPEEGEERTVFMPGGGGDRRQPPRRAARRPSPRPPPPAEPRRRSPPTAARPPRHPDLRAAQGRVGIKVGDVLNHIFEVKRFLARGGMGEVFEGCNVNTDEKVAIKVMLPALANDEKVIAMFRKEARTLTKLHHQALVQYRVLAQEPQLHVLYIVTDFIEGTNLGSVARHAEALARASSPGCCGGSPRASARRTSSAPSIATCRRTTSSSRTTTSTRPRSSISESPRISTRARRRSSATASPAS